MEQALRLHVRRDERDLLRRASRELEVAQRLLVHGKDPHGGAVFGSHVADRGAVGDRQRRDAGAVELHKFPDDTFLAEHFGHGEHEVGRRRAFGDLSREPNPTTWGMSIETGWPSIAASASMPPTPQPSTPRPLIIVVCESVPTRVSGYAWGVGPAVVNTTRARYSRLTWWTMPVSGGTTRNPWNVCCAQRSRA